MLIKYIRAIKNRILFLSVKGGLKSCGTKTLLESPFVLFGKKYISLGKCIRTKPRLRLEAIDKIGKDKFFPELKIGDNVSIGYDVHIGCVNKIIIGNGVLLASKVFITDHGHGDTDEKTLQIPPSERKLYSKGPVIIEDNVWIGEGAAIMPGVIIGRNSIIGANAVVTKAIPSYSVAVGVPAKVIRKR